MELDNLVNAVATLIDVKDLPDESIDENNVEHVDRLIAENTIRQRSGRKR